MATLKSLFKFKEGSKGGQSCSIMQKSFEERKAESERIKTKYPDRVPIIVTKSNNATNVPDIDKQKYLVPRELTAGQLIYVIRKRVKLSPDQALFIFVESGRGSILPPTAQLIDVLYSQHQADDGFLYVTYSGESTFG